MNMELVNDLENKVQEYLDGDYEVTETQTIPSVDNVPFGKKAKKMQLCAYCIDLRKSSDLLTIHQKRTSGKIHKAFLAVASKVVLEYGENIRSFNGDSILAFWPASYISQISKAVEAAMITKWFLDIKLSPLFEKYEKIDFGIGLDWGEVYIVRAGIPRDTNNNDLVFIGKCVNFATAIANQAHAPYHVEISEVTYKNLTDDRIYGVSNGAEVNMWKDDKVEWNGKKYDSKITTWHIYLK
jgi:class 3 adenylate cyclase